MLTIEQQAADALKSIARDQQIKAYLMNSPEMYPVVLRAAKRYIAGESREEGIQKSKILSSKGYLVSIEYIGENTQTAEECVKARDEFAGLIRDITGESPVVTTVCLDLSHIGLTVSPDLAAENLRVLAEVGKENGISIVISMEESSKTSEILRIYKDVATVYPNVGITVQAHLYRSIDDLIELLRLPGKIRIVKGAYQEPLGIAMPRSKELDKRFLEMVGMCVQAKHPASIASHDENILREAISRGYLDFPFVETEMLYGVKHDLLKRLKNEGYRTRAYLTYGTEWYLYMCHRLAEHVPSLYVAIADMVNTQEVNHEMNY